MWVCVAVWAKRGVSGWSSLMAPVHLVCPCMGVSVGVVVIVRV